MENQSQLVEGCRAGKEWARKELYTLYAEQLLAVCYRYTGDPDTAHDLLHDGFIKIFTGFTYSGEGSLGGWLHKIMVNLALDHLRKKRQLQEISLDEEVLPEETEELPQQEIRDSIPESMLLEFVAELPEGYRTVFNLYVFEDRSHKEIGEILGIKERSSSSQYHRAKQLLAKKIQEYTRYEKGRG